MKPTIKYTWLLLILLPAISCTTQNIPYDTDMALVIDKTDQFSVYPTAGEIISELGLRTDPWQAVRITATYASDRDINNVKEVTLGAESKWSGNLPLRKSKIQHFIQQVQQCLNGMRYTGSCPHSIVYRTVARQANRLAVSKANNRLLLVYSDLAENDVDLNFYNPHTIERLQKAQNSVDQQLQAEVRLKQLHGLQVYLIYNPQSFAQNNAYMKIAEFYQHLLTAHGAVPHIANKFQPL